MGLYTGTLPGVEVDFVEFSGVQRSSGLLVLTSAQVGQFSQVISEIRKKYNTVVHLTSKHFCIKDYFLTSRGLVWLSGRVLVD